MVRAPALPVEISPDGREIWDWAGKMSDRLHAMDELARLRIQAHNTRNTCGSCSAWMTSACPREVHDNRRGRSQGPSSMATKCDRFKISSADAKSAELADAKILALQQRMQAL